MRKSIGSILRRGRREPSGSRKAGAFRESRTYAAQRDLRGSALWMTRNIAVGILLSLAVAYLFYRSVWAVALAVVLVPLYLKSQWDRRDRAQTQELQHQFLSGMQMVSGSLRAGYSMENAWRKAEKELAALYGPDAVFCIEMRRMNQKLAVNEPLEKILAEFAAESGVDDICDFSEIYGYAKRSGGNLTEIIHTVTERMQEKEKILTEIETSVAAQRMEQRMMDLLLPGILFFITISSPSYVTSLYHNPLGIFVMSACLGGYLACIYWSEKIMDIKV